MTNTNMRRGFTMIELIFVIVIIGILAAVAIPKLASTATEAKKSTMVSFMGTLNRTVGPSLWATAVSSTGGKIDGGAYTMTDYTEVPEGIVFDLTKCDDNGTAVAATVPTSILPNEEKIYCKNGTSVSAPKFGFGKGTTSADVNTSLQKN